MVDQPSAHNNKKPNVSSPRKPSRTSSVRRASSARGISSTQVMFAVIVAIGLMLSINFSTRITADRDLQRIRDTITQEIALLEREQIDLLANLAYVESDAYVEAWARSESKMVREGEVLVLPVRSNQLAPSNTSIQPIIFEEVETTLPQPQNWQLWWSLFFDSPPPQF